MSVLGGTLFGFIVARVSDHKISPIEITTHSSVSRVSSSETGFTRLRSTFFFSTVFLARPFFADDFFECLLFFPFPSFSD